MWSVLHAFLHLVHVVVCFTRVPEFSCFFFSFVTMNSPELVSPEPTAGQIAEFPRQRSRPKTVASFLGGGTVACGRGGRMKGGAIRGSWGTSQNRSWSIVPMRCHETVLMSAQRPPLPFILGCGRQRSRSKASRPDQQRLISGGSHWRAAARCARRTSRA